jgi:hypothetical protein
MKQLKTLALSAAITGAFALSPAANAAVVDVGTFFNTSVTNFCTSGDTYRTGFYAYTCYTGGGTAPTASHMAVETMPATAQITLFEFLDDSGPVDIETGSLQITGLGSILTGSLSYFVELLPPPGFTPSDEPDLRLTFIELTNEILTNGTPGNVLTTKQITGQNTVVVPDATFTANLSAGADERDGALCGICRRFAITDTVNNQVNGAVSRGFTQSMTNTFQTTLVPAPAPLALVAFGLVGLGALNRRRKA